MRVRFLLVAALSLTFACSTPPAKNNGSTNGTTNGATNGATNNCKALPACEAGFEEVEECGDRAQCTTVQKCGVEIFCAPIRIRADDFDQSCSFDSDCVPINEGDPCACHVCSDAAISASAQSEYEAVIASAMCAEIACPAIACGEEFIPHCPDGTCTLRTAKYVDTDGFDTSCETVDDCAAVFEGEVCAICACANAAINLDERQAYQAQFDVECRTDAVCDVCPQPPLDCVEGRCELTSN